MEDTLRAAKAAFEGKQATVLILVLMEDTLRAYYKVRRIVIYMS